MTFDREFFSLGSLDALSYKNTVVHRLAPRTKVVASLAFIGTVISFPKYEISGLMPFFLYPALVFSLGDIPVWLVVRKALCISPFVIFIGILNPVFDQQTVCSVLGVPVSGGALSFFSMLLRFLLTVTAVLLLIATTSFPGICNGLRRLGVPALFISQLLFLYRYIFVLMEEAMRMVRARNMRRFGTKGGGLPVFVSMIGTLFLRTVERAERIYRSMLSRGFSGTIPYCGSSRTGLADVVFLFVMAASLGFCRFVDVAGAVGRLAERLL